MSLVKYRLEGHPNKSFTIDNDLSITEFDRIFLEEVQKLLPLITPYIYTWGEDYIVVTDTADLNSETYFEFVFHLDSY